MRSDTTRDVDSGETQGIARSVSEVDGLLLLLALLYLVAGRARIAYPISYLGAVGAFGGIIVLFRFTRFLSDRPRTKLTVLCTTMVIFVTAILALSGDEPGALVNLYLLPIITSALALGRSATLLQLLLVCAGRLLISVLIQAQDIVSIDYVLTLVTELAPIFLIALLTTTLADDINAAKQRIRTLSDQDGLTGLYNMRAFYQLLQDEHRRAQRRGANYALLMVDVDGLKSINDGFGHEAGNRAIVAVGHALRRSTRSLDIVARYGGDEFVVFLGGAGPDIAELVSNRIRHNVYHTTLDIENQMRRISVSIGVAVYPVDGRDPRGLLNRADAAMYREKEMRHDARGRVGAPG